MALNANSARRSAWVDGAESCQPPIFPSPAEATAITQYILPASCMSGPETRWPRGERMRTMPSSRRNTEPEGARLVLRVPQAQPSSHSRSLPPAAHRSTIPGGAGVSLRTPATRQPCRRRPGPPADPPAPPLPAYSGSSRSVSLRVRGRGRGRGRGRVGRDPAGEARPSRRRPPPPLT